VEPGAGDDRSRGGPGGYDLLAHSITLEEDPNQLGVIVNIAAGTETGQLGTDSFTGFEDVSGSGLADIFLGDNGPNVITGVGFVGADYIDGGRGDDTLSADSSGGNSIYGEKGMTTSKVEGMVCHTWTEVPEPTPASMVMSW